MKVLIFGTSGMVGQGVLRECLADPARNDPVDSVLRELGTGDRRLDRVDEERFRRQSRQGTGQMADGRTRAAGDNYRF